MVKDPKILKLGARFWKTREETSDKDNVGEALRLVFFKLSYRTPKSINCYVGLRWCRRTVASSNNSPYVPELSCTYKDVGWTHCLLEVKHTQYYLTKMTMKTLKQHKFKSIRLNTVQLINLLDSQNTERIKYRWYFAETYSR